MNTFSRTNAVRGFTRWGERSTFGWPPSSMSRPSWGLAVFPSRICRLARSRRFIWATFPLVGRTSMPSFGSVSVRKTRVRVSLSQRTNCRRSELCDSREPKEIRASSSLRRLFVKSEKVISVFERYLGGSTTWANSSSNPIVLRVLKADSDASFIWTETVPSFF